MDPIRRRRVTPIRRLVTTLLVLFLVGGGVPATAGGEWWPGLGDARRYAEARGDVSFAIVDGERPSVLFGYRSWRSYESASVLKVMFLVAYLRQNEVRHRDLRRADRRLLRPMITWSDNATATRIADMLGPRPMYRLAQDAGMSSFRYTRPWGRSIVNAREQTRFMSKLERYIPRRHRPYARYLLSHIVASQRWGIASLDLGGWKLFFKGGWGSGTGAVTHQVAFLERDGRRISLAVLTRNNPSHSYGVRTLRGVAARLLRGLPGT